jgi:uncharacterized membrane protein
MNQNEFIQRLKNNLSGVSFQERQEILDDYLAHFEAGKAAGKTEEKIAEELGDPYEIAGMYKTELVVKDHAQQKSQDKNNIKTTNDNTAQMVLVILALLAFNAIVMLPIVSTVLGILVTFFVTALVLAISGLVVSVAGFFSPVFVVFFNPIFGVIATILWGIALLCFGILFFVGMIYMTKWLIKLMGMYVNFNIKLVKEAEGSN